jgi:hypothetical protein
MLRIKHGNGVFVMSMLHRHWLALNYGPGVAMLGMKNRHGVAVLSVKRGLENKIVFLLLNKWFRNNMFIWLFEIFINVYLRLGLKCVGFWPGERLVNLV